MNRPSLLVLGTVLTIAMTGCLSGPTGDVAPTAVPVTTSSADDVAVVGLQLSVRDDADGPLSQVTLRNDGASEATVKVETVLTFDTGATHAGGSVVTLPAGDESMVEYLVVSYDELSDAERELVRTGDGVTIELRLNGQPRRA